MNTNAVNLQQLLHKARFAGCQDISVSQVRDDSRTIQPGDVFVAISGTRCDGHDFLKAAVASGARAVVTERFVEDLPVPQCVVSCSATAYARICMALNCGPSPAITSAGITGTNGKTTTSFMLRSILRQAGLATGLISTIENCDGDCSQPASMTTPSADAVAAQFRRMVQRQTSHCVVEISSHALVQKRCAAVPLSAAAVTNVTQDHFDYHKTADAYRCAKAQIAGLLYPDAPLLLNYDDEGCRLLAAELPSEVPVISLGVDYSGAELRAAVLSKTHRSQRVQLTLAQGSAEVRLRLIGQHNVSNSLAAAGLAEQLGVRLKDIVSGLEAVHSVPGRLERISEGQPFQVLIDYAHTPDALLHSICTIRDFVPGRLICVFGAGGDRDRSKRPQMGAAAASADLAIVTTDNPRSESTQSIIRDITDGFSSQATYLTEPDRRSAIARAFEAAEPGDVVLIAGRGHESTQQIGNQHVSFDDRVVSRQLLQEREDTGAVTGLTPVFSLPRSA